MDKIFSALVKAQRAFGPALKSSTNPHFRSKYADLSACVEAVVGALNENGVFLTQRLDECDTGVIVETIFAHESGESLSSGRLHVPASKADAQGYGSALTYARRYSLMAACGIAPEDDDGNAAVRGKPAADMSGHLKAISEAANGQELTKLFMDAMRACGGDQSAQAAVIAAKKARVERAKQEKANG